MDLSTDSTRTAVESQPSAVERRADALLEIALATSTLELDEVLDRVVQLTSGLVGADRCSIFLLNDDRSSLLSAAIHGIDPGWAAAWRRKSYRLEAERLSHHVLTTLQPLIVENATDHPLTDKEAVAFFGDKSILVVPLVSRGEALGTIFLNYIREPHRFRDDEIELTMALASQAAVAIHNAQLYEQSRETSDALRWSMRQLGSMAVSPNLDDILRSIAQIAARLIKVPSCGIRLFDESTGRLSFRAAVGIPPDVLALGDLRPGEGLSGRVMTEGQPVWSADMRADIRAHNEEFIEKLGLRGYLGVPLFGHGQAVGVLCAYTIHLHHFSAEEIDLLSSFADQAALAVENARLFTQIQGRADELSQLQRIGNSLTSSLDVTPLLETVARGAIEITQADSGSIFLVRPDSLDVERVVSFPVGRDHVHAIRRPTGMTSWVIESGSIVVVPDAAEDQRIHPNILRDGTRSILGMPLRDGERIVGVLWANSNRPSHFGAHHVEILSVLADQIALVLRNARLYQEVQREKEELETIFLNVSDGIIVFNDNRELRDVNPAAAMLLSESLENLAGRSCRSVLHCDETASCSGDDCRLLQTRDGRPSHWQASLLSIGPIDLEISAVPVQLPDAGAPFHVVVLHDVTESKRVERAKSDFISMVSHELRTPLSLVKGYASTLLRKELALDSATQQRFVRNIDAAADRLARLVNDLLSVTRLETGRFELKKSRFDLRTAIEHAAGAGLPSGQPVELSLPPEPVIVDADRERIEQVIDNLVRNSHLHSGTMRPVKVSLLPVWSADEPIELRPGFERFAPSPLPSNGRFAVVSVSDEGKGVGPKTMRQVFDKFYRSQASAQVAVGGMGLGLYLTRGLVEAHNGRIWVESAIGKGTTFRFALPLGDGPGLECEAT